MTVKLKREVVDLDTVRSAMEYLKSIRDKEGQIDQEFAPVEEMYAMLARYEGRVAKEEVDDVGDAGGRGACGADAGGCCAPRRACGLALSARSAACEERFDQAPLLCAWLCAWLCALL